MKKLILLLVIPFLFACSSKKKANIFTKVDPNNAEPALSVPDTLLKYVSKYTKLNVNMSAMPSLASESEEFIMPVPIGDKIYNTTMHRVNISPEGLTVQTSDSLPQEQINITHYRGAVDGKKSVVAMSFIDGEPMGVIGVDNTNLVLGKIAGTSQVIIYDEKDLKDSLVFECISLPAPPNRQPAKMSTEKTVNGCISVWWETDYDLFVNKGSVAAVNAYMQGVFNQVSALYQADGMTLTLKTLYIWSTVDPYTQTSTSGLLTQFQNYRTDVNGATLSHLIGLNGGGGIAYVDAMCSPFNYAYSGIGTTYSVVPTFSWTVEVLAHETGHGVGSNHTQACVWNVLINGVLTPNQALSGCYTQEGSCAKGPYPDPHPGIMGYCHLTAQGIHFEEGFQEQPSALMRGKIAAYSCLPTCNPPPDTCTTHNTISFSITPSANPVPANTTVTFTSTGTHLLTPTYVWKVNTIQKATTPNYSYIPLNNDVVNCTVTSAEKCLTSQSATASVTMIVTTTPPPSCSTPSGLSSSAPTTSTINLNWVSVSGATSYNVQYKPTSATAWTTKVVATNGLAASGLSAGTAYQWQVQAVCASGNSTFSSVATFTTPSGPPPTCGTPINLLTDNVSSDKARANCDVVTGAQKYNYKLDSVVYSNVLSNFYTFSGLNSGSTYHWSAQAVCQGGVLSNYSAAQTFSTSGTTTCPWTVAIDVNTSNNGTIVVFSVSASGGTNYSYQFRKGTTTLPASTNNKLTLNNYAGEDIYCVVTNGRTCGQPKTLTTKHIKLTIQ